jgi:hypothetical protein
MLKKLANGLVALGGAVASGVPSFVRDVAGLAGAASIAYGFYLVSPPYGFISGGGLLLIGALLTALAPLPPPRA